MMKNIKIATLISYATLISGNFISLIYTPFILTTLGSGEYGLYSLTNTIISYIYLLDMGIENAVIRYNAKYIAKGNDEERENLNGMFFILYCGIALVSALIGLIMYKNFDIWFSKSLTLYEVNRIKIMFLISIVNIVCAFPLNIFNGIVVAQEKFIYNKLLALIRTIINPIVMITILLCGYRAVGMLIGSTILNILLGLINVIFCFKYLILKLKFNKFNRDIFKEIFKFSFFIFLSSIAYRIYWSTDQFILGMFVSSSAIAIYSIASQLNGYFTSFSNVINNMFLPKLTKLTTTENRTELMNILVKTSRIQYFIAIFVLIGYVLIGKVFINIWAGPDYHDSYYIALIMMVAQLVSIIQALFAILLEAMNKHQVKSIIYLGVAIFNLILTLILVKPFGAIGCAMATSIGCIINIILNNIYYRYNLKLDMIYYWKQILKLVPATLLILIVGNVYVKLISPQDYLGIFLFGVIFTLTYLLIMWIIGFNTDEKNIIKSILLMVRMRNKLVITNQS